MVVYFHELQISRKTQGGLVSGQRIMSSLYFSSFWPTFLSYQPVIQKLLQRNDESKSFGKWNPFVGWTLVRPNYPISTAVRKESLVTLASIESAVQALVMRDSERCEASIWKPIGLEAVALHRSTQ